MGKPALKSNRVVKPKANESTIKSKSENKVDRKVKNRPDADGKSEKPEKSEDSAILHPPIDISVSGLRQISQIFEKGTSELQDLLSFECDVILECKVCRNLFRSLANFLSHKRVYCTAQHQTSNQLLHTNNKLEVDCGSSNPADAVHPDVIKTKLKNPARMIPRSNLAAVLNARCFAKPVFMRSGRNECSPSSEHSLLLQTLQGSNAGVFQTYYPNSSSLAHPPSMKEQMEELYSAQSQTESMDSMFLQVNGEDGSSEFMRGHPDSECNKMYTCDDCGLLCSTVEVLQRHKRQIHAIARKCYLCPCCKDSFPNTWSVHRHLFKVHHKTNEQVRKLRLQIKSKILKPGKTTKELPDKTKTVQPKITDQEKWNLENEEWLDQLEKDDLLRCGSCGRKFERRAALKAHSRVCQSRVSVSSISSIQCRVTSEKLSNPADLQPKSDNEDLKLHPVVALTALTPAQIKDSLSAKDKAPEKKIGIQVRMDYCKNTSSNSLAEERVPKPSPVEVITIDEDRTHDRSKTCLETLLTKKRNNRSDSGNDSESQDDMSVGLDFSSDSVINEDLIKLNMHDIPGISSTDSNIGSNDTAFEGSVRIESANDEFTSESIPNKRKKACPVKRRISAKKMLSKKSNDGECVFRREGVKATYANCKKKTAPGKVYNFSHSCPEHVKQLTDYYNKTDGVCLLCNSHTDPSNILQHISEHGRWIKFRCKWPECTYKAYNRVELILHVTKEHKFKNGEVAHDFVDLISREDWKFVVATSANNSSVLLGKVTELNDRLNGKERINGSGPLLKNIFEVAKDVENSVPSKENIEESTESDTKPECIELDSSMSDSDIIDVSSSDEENFEGFPCSQQPYESNNTSSERARVINTECGSPSEDQSSGKGAGNMNESISRSSRLASDSNIDDEVKWPERIKDLSEGIPRESSSNTEVTLEEYVEPNVEPSNSPVNTEASITSRLLDEPLSPEAPSSPVSISESLEMADSPETSVNPSTKSPVDSPSPDSDERTLASPVTYTICDISMMTDDDEDDSLDESHCDDTTDADPSSSAYGKSGMDVEMDDDHLRAVMMEMIFGQTSDSPTSSHKFTVENHSTSKKQKLLDTELNV